MESADAMSPEEQTLRKRDFARKAMNVIGVVSPIVGITAFFFPHPFIVGSKMLLEVAAGVLQNHNDAGALFAFLLMTPATWFLPKIPGMGWFSKLVKR